MAIPTVLALCLTGVALICALVLSVLSSGRRIHGHSLRIGRLRWLSLHDVRYSYLIPGEHKPRISSSIESIHLRFRCPRTSNPHWATIIIGPLVHDDGESSGRAAGLALDLLLFPYALGFSAGPWVRLTVDGVHLSVFASARTPNWVARIRKNVIATLLTGTIVRCDDFVAKVRFAPLGSTLARPDPDASPTDPREPPPLGTDELAAHVSWRGMRVHDDVSRMCTFGAVEGVVRRSPLARRGVLWLSTREVRWTQLRASWQSEAVVRPWSQIGSAILLAPYNLYEAWTEPSSLVDVYVTELNVAFDDFHLRDAELVRQGAVLAQARLGDELVTGTMFFDALFDALAWVVAP